MHHLSKAFRVEPDDLIVENIVEISWALGARGAWPAEGSVDGRRTVVRWAKEFEDWWQGPEIRDASKEDYPDAIQRFVDRKLVTRRLLHGHPEKDAV